MSATFWNLRRRMAAQKSKPDVIMTDLAQKDEKKPPAKKKAVKNSDSK